jgi:hypothetical protein
MIWQHKIVIFKAPLDRPEDDKALLIRQAEARYDAIGVEGWELVTTSSVVIGEEVHTWTIWKRPFIEKAQAA